MTRTKLKVGLLATGVFSLGMMLHIARFTTIFQGSTVPRNVVLNVTMAIPVKEDSTHDNTNLTIDASINNVMNLLYRLDHPNTTTAQHQQPTMQSPDSTTSHHDNLTTQPLRVLLLSYQRSGSSIISSLFGDDPSVFFIYEPLDSLYNAIYGTSAGWNVPSDITVNADGSLRKLPEIELAETASFMNHIYSCDFQNLPIEFLVHPFWYYFSNWTVMLKPYTSCLRASGLTEKSLSTVQRLLRMQCGVKFMDTRAKQNKCLGKLWPNYTNTALSLKQTLGSPSERAFGNYWSHISGLGKKTNYCMEKYLRKPCLGAQIRATKTVRATMDEAERLLMADPQLKVIHLMRDPRGVTRSRNKASWSRGVYDKLDIGKIAHVYCSTVLADLETRHKLEKQYPDRLFGVLLEDLVENPDRVLVDLFDFLKIELKPQVRDHFHKRMKSGFTDTWRRTLKSTEVASINKVCANMLHTLDIPL